MVDVATGLGKGFRSVTFGFRFHERFNTMARDFTVSTVVVDNKVLIRWELKNTDDVRLDIWFTDRELSEGTAAVVEEFDLSLVLEARTALL